MQFSCYQVAKRGQKRLKKRVNAFYTHFLAKVLTIRPQYTDVLRGQAEAVG